MKRAFVLGLFVCVATTGCQMSVLSKTTSDIEDEVVKKRLNVITFHGEDEGRSLFRIYDGTAEEDNTLSLLQIVSWKAEPKDN